MPLTMAAFVVAGLASSARPAPPASSPSGIWRSARSRRAGGRSCSSSSPARCSRWSTSAASSRSPGSVSHPSGAAAGQGPAALHAGADAAARRRDDLLRLRYRRLGAASPSQAATPCSEGSMIPRLEPEALMLPALAIPFVAAAADPAVSPPAEPARAGDAVGRRHACRSVVWSLLGRVLDGARPELHLLEVVPGFVLALRGRAARHAVRAGCRLACGSSIRSTRSATCAATASRARPPTMSALRWRSAPPWGSHSPRTCSRCSCSTSC